MTLLILHPPAILLPCSGGPSCPCSAPGLATQGARLGACGGGGMSACEWSPSTNQPALTTDPSHAESVWSVGSGKNNIHLCDQCRQLPRFAKMKAKPLKRTA